jgi:hypothetical protein
MRNGKWNLAFWTTGNKPSEQGEGFGCSSHGLCAKGLWVEPGEKASAVWSNPLEGTVLSGTFEQVASSLNGLQFSPTLILAFAAVGTGPEGFLDNLRSICPCKAVAGGCAARNTDRGELAPEAPEVTLLAVKSGAFEVEGHNLLEPSISLAFEARGPRTVNSLQIDPDGALLPGIQAFSELQRRSGKASADHESITLSDLSGRNLHFHEEDGLIVSGADLPEAGPLVLRVAEPAAIASRMESLLAVPGTLLLGCAGLRGTLPRPLQAAEGSLGAFLFGEIGPFDGRPAFGNLMVTTVHKIS